MIDLEPDDGEIDNNDDEDKLEELEGGMMDDDELLPTQNNVKYCKNLTITPVSTVPGQKRKTTNKIEFVKIDVILAIAPSEVKLFSKRNGANANI